MAGYKTQRSSRSCSCRAFSVFPLFPDRGVQNQSIAFDARIYIDKCVTKLVQIKTPRVFPRLVLFWLFFGKMRFIAHTRSSVEGVGTASSEAHIAIAMAARAFGHRPRSTGSSSSSSSMPAERQIQRIAAEKEEKRDRDGDGDGDRQRKRQR
jgi:hypothetical protein